MEITDLRQNEAKVGVESDVSMVLLYEDSETGLRAMHSLNGLQTQMHVPFCLRPRLWRRDLLKPAWLREQAAREAAEAETIILSLHGGEGLTREVREWLCRWLEFKEDRPYALGLLLDAAHTRSAMGNPVVDYLQTIARKGKADLILGFCDEPVCDAKPSAHRVAPSLLGMPAYRGDQWPTVERYAHWGINE